MGSLTRIDALAEKGRQSYAHSLSERSLQVLNESRLRPFAVLSASRARTLPLQHLWLQDQRRFSGFLYVSIGQVHRFVTPAGVES